MRPVSGRRSQARREAYALVFVFLLAAFLAGCTSPDKDIYIFNALDSPISVDLDISSSNRTIYQAATDVPPHDFVKLPDPARLHPGMYSVRVETTNQSTTHELRVTADMTALDVDVREHGIEIAMRIP